MDIDELQNLSDECVKTFTLDDIIEHLEEELIELLLAIKRVRRRREDVSSFIEEMFDVTIEINTVLTGIIATGIDDEKYRPLFESKLKKFESMLLKYNREDAEGLKRRYYNISELEF